MVTLVKADVKFISDNNGAMFTKKQGSEMHVVGLGDRTIQISGETGYENPRTASPLKTTASTKNY